jgi:hypothetical protein
MIKTNFCIYVFILNPSAGIGRQGKFKLCWYYIVNVQVVPRINIIYIIFNIEIFNLNNIYCIKKYLIQ